ncbi:MAG: chalcone isomerase family protein [Alcanivorax sp.]|nr:chalcone isomerase family protein [Alcanivorax sp.]
MTHRFSGSALSRLIVSALAAAALSHAAMADDLTDPASFFGDDAPAMQECTRGDVRALRFIRVGEARLSLDDCARNGLPLKPPLRLQFSYRRDVPGDAFAEAAETMIKRNADADTFDALQSRIQAFNANYRDIGNGDTYQLDYAPDGRLLLSLNGEPLAEESGDDFALNYLSIWFGDDPYNDRLKRDLLGN